MPLRATAGSAGIDLYSSKAYRIYENAKMAVSTGIAIQLPVGTYGKIEARSGLARDYGIQIMGGVIDADYTGEIIVLMVNTGNRPLNINPGDRIAQLVIQPYIAPMLVVVDDLGSTERGAGGFGHTGI